MYSGDKTTAQREASVLPIRPGHFPLGQKVKIRGNKPVLGDERSKGTLAEMKTEWGGRRNTHCMSRNPDIVTLIHAEI